MQVLVLTGLVIATTLLLEWSGVLLFIGYPVVRLLAMLGGAVALRYGWRRRPRNWWTSAAALGSALTIVALGFMVSDLELSPRKTFVRRANMVRPGLLREEADRIMRGYEQWSTGANHVSYRFMSRIGTVDVLVVHLDAANRVACADLSFD